MAGEIIKGTVNVANIALNGTNLAPVLDGNGNAYFNEIAAYDYNTDNPQILSLSNTSYQNVDPRWQKLTVDQGKAFVNTQVTFDPGVPAANVAATINDRINSWKVANGNRYDDFQVVINPSGINHDITIIITRYF